MRLYFIYSERLNGCLFHGGRGGFGPLFLIREGPWAPLLKNPRSNTVFLSSFPIVSTSPAVIHVFFTQLQFFLLTQVALSPWIPEQVIAPVPRQGQVNPCTPAFQVFQFFGVAPM